MAERGCVWTDDEIHCILAIWSEDGIECKLNGCHRKDRVWQKIAQALKRQNDTRRRLSLRNLNMYHKSPQT